MRRNGSRVPRELTRQGFGHGVTQVFTDAHNEYGHARGRLGLVGLVLLMVSLAGVAARPRSARATDPGCVRPAGDDGGGPQLRVDAAGTLPLL
jgi:hypothetical protein